jgi:hypothetical protein
MPWLDGAAGYGSRPSSTRGFGIGANDNDHLARFADSLLFSPTAASAGVGALGGVAPNAFGMNVDGISAGGGGEDMHEIASYFNLPSPLPSLTPPGATSGRGYAFSFDNIPQGPGRINPLVAAAFVNPGRVSGQGSQRPPSSRNSGAVMGQYPKASPSEAVRRQQLDSQQKFQHMIHQQEQMNNQEAPIMLQKLGVDRGGKNQGRMGGKGARKQPPPMLSIPG